LDAKSAPQGVVIARDFTVSDTFGGSAEASFGTWNTQLYRGTLQTGEIGRSGIKAVFVGEHKKTDGALSNAPLRADNFFAKVAIPVGAGQLTIISSYNDNYFNQSDNNGATLDQVARFGKGFSLSDPNAADFANNPYKQTRFDINFTHKRSDFEIVRLEIPLTDNFSVDNKAYTYFYKNYTVSPSDSISPSSTLSTSPKINGVITKVQGNIPGYTKLNQYRVYGNILEGHYDMGFGTLHAGAWLEFSNTHRYRYDYDFTSSTITNGALVNGINNFDQKTVGQIGIAANGAAITGPLLQLNGQPVPQNIQFDEHSSWFQQQYFAQFDWRVSDDLTITPGVKHIHFTRNILSPIATQKTRQGTISEANYNTTLPFATVNYRIRSNWSAYGQFAKGFLIPYLSTLEVAVPSPLATDPTKTTNYQLGTVFSGENLNIDANVYLIKLSNTIECLGAGGALCTNTGHPSTYKGVEGQVSLVPIKGLIPTLTDIHPWAHWRSPMDMMRQG
jgi:iron complex outermembrane receptor protein